MRLSHSSVTHFPFNDPKLPQLAKFHWFRVTILISVHVGASSDKPLLIN